MPVTATFALGAPGGTPSVLSLQPTIIEPIPGEFDGKKSGGVIQNGYDWFVAEFTRSPDGESIISQAECAVVTAAWHAAKSTDGRRSVTYFSMYASGGAGADQTADAIMDQPTYLISHTGVFSGVRVLFRDVRPR